MEKNKKTIYEKPIIEVFPAKEYGLDDVLYVNSVGAPWNDNTGGDIFDD